MRREESAPPARAEAGTLGAESGGSARVWPAVKRETPTPVGVWRAGDIRPDPNVSCLVQKLVATPYSNVGPAMMGSMAAAERIPHFSDEDRGTLLKDWLNDLWIKRDNYNWTDEQVARLILEGCKGRAGVALAVIPPQDRVRLQFGCSVWRESSTVMPRRLLVACCLPCGCAGTGKPSVSMP